MSLVLRKPAFCICGNKDADQLRGNREADQRLCFHYKVVQSLYYLNPKFQASSHLLRLYRPVGVGPGRNSRRPVFSERGSYLFLYTKHLIKQLISCNLVTHVAFPSLRKVQERVNLILAPTIFLVRGFSLMVIVCWVGTALA